MQRLIGGELLAGWETQAIFADWLADPFSLVLAAPSVIMDLSYNVLLHPGHPAYDQINVVDQTILPVDERFWRYHSVSVGE